MPRNSDRAKELTEGIVKMVVLDLEPYKLVDHEGFRNFVKIAEPRYQMPSRNTISKEVSLFYKSESARIKDEIQNDLKNGNQNFYFLLKLQFARLKYFFLKVVYKNNYYIQTKFIKFNVFEIIFYYNINLYKYLI